MVVLLVESELEGVTYVGSVLMEILMRQQRLQQVQVFGELPLQILTRL